MSQGRRTGEEFHHLFPKSLFEAGCIPQLPALHLVPNNLNKAMGGIYPYIGSDKDFLKFIQNFGVHLPVPQKKALQAPGQALAGADQTLSEAAEKALPGLRDSQFFVR
jgi:hypothetical protein